MTDELGLTPCTILGCDAAVTPGDRCHDHGGDPDFEVRVTEWGETTYSRREAADPDEDAE